MRNKKIKIEEGICKLTHKKGRFVDSHILPRALTLLSKSGERALQTSLDLILVKRFQGWYDNSLAINDGEKILSEIDNKAIKILRKNHLVWSGWPSLSEKLPCKKEQISNISENCSIRTIEGVDLKPLKIFFVSIVWRAAASSREDMRDVCISDETLEKLRIAILNQESLSKTDFPVRLHQLANRGFTHNRTPIIERQLVPLPPPYIQKEYTFCRIYMDGLIAYVALDADDIYVENCGNLIIGAQESLWVFINNFEQSRTFSDMKEVFFSQNKLL